MMDSFYLHIQYKKPFKILTIFSRIPKGSVSFWKASNAFSKPMKFVYSDDCHRILCRMIICRVAICSKHNFYTLRPVTSSFNWVPTAPFSSLITFLPEFCLVLRKASLVLKVWKTAFLQEFNNKTFLLVIQRTSFSSYIMPNSSLLLVQSSKCSNHLLWQLIYSKCLSFELWASWTLLCKTNPPDLFFCSFNKLSMKFSPPTPNPTGIFTFSSVQCFSFLSLFQFINNLYTVFFSHPPGFQQQK